jgi:hypothetical protein
VVQKREVRFFLKYLLVKDQEEGLHPDVHGCEPGAKNQNKYKTTKLPFYWTIVVHDLEHGGV